MNMDDYTESISGYAAVYWKPGDRSTEFEMGDMTERIKPGAFAKVLGTGDIASYTNHDPNFLLARQSSDPLSLALREDLTGLHARIFPFDTSAGRDAITMVRNRGLRGMSFGFSMAGGKDTWTEENGRTIRTLEQVGKLFDSSPVVHPAYVGTTCRIELAQRSAITQLERYDSIARELRDDRTNTKGTARILMERSDDRTRGQGRNVAELQKQTLLRLYAERTRLVASESTTREQLEALDRDQRSLTAIMERRA
jgi:HK97 family phage prohead protease